METNERFKFLERLKLKDLSDIDTSFKNCNGLIHSENELFSSYMEKLRIAELDPKNITPKDVLKPLVMTVGKHKISLNPYDHECSHVFNNICHEELELSTNLMKDLLAKASATNRSCHKQVLNYTENVKLLKKLIAEMDEITTHKNFDQWLQRHLTHTQTKVMKHDVEKADFNHHAGKAKHEIEKCKFKAKIKPIQVISSHYDIELTEKQVTTVIKERHTCMKHMNKKRKAQTVAKQQEFENQRIAADCQETVDKMRAKLKDVESKLLKKQEKGRKLLAQIRGLEKKKEKMQIVGKIGFCDVVSKKDQLVKNKDTVLCLMKKLNQMKSKKKREAQKKYNAKGSQDEV